MQTAHGVYSAGGRIEEERDAVASDRQESPGGNDDTT